MQKFKETDLIEKFNAVNDRTGEQIEIFYYSKSSTNGRGSDEYIVGDGRVLVPMGGVIHSKFKHLLSDDTYTRI